MNRDDNLELFKIFVFLAVGVAFFIAFKIKTAFGVDWPTSFKMFTQMGLVVLISVVLFKIQALLISWPTVLWFSLLPIWTAVAFKKNEAQAFWRYDAGPWYYEWYVPVIVTVALLIVQLYLVFRNRY